MSAMQTITKKRTDAELDRAVTEELRWDPRVDDSNLAVSVKDGIVTLAGYSDGLAKKMAACDAAHRVAGVLDVVDQIEVRYAGRPITDAELAKDVRHALERDVFVEDSKIKSTVSEGRVRLEGEVEFPFQRQDAARAIERLKGVLSVTNMIVVNAKRVDAKQIEASIQGALARRAQREARRIGIEVTGTTVKLTGTVDSWAEKAALDSVALFSPGVSKVDNQLKVDSFR